MTKQVTNFFSHIQFEITDYEGNQWQSFDLSGFIPGGLLAREHLQWRYNAGTGGVWSNWGIFEDATTRNYNETTRVANIYSPPRFVQFRRVTPRYVLLMDPLKGFPTTEPTLRSNATQGLFVAIELAGEAGINAYVLGNPPELPIGQARTQTRWPADHPFKQAKVYNFHFAGGYLAREHVRVQIKLDGVWTEYIIGDDNFIGPWQLRMDFSSVPGDITGLVVRRFTPRDGTVAVVEDGYVVGPRGLDPTARHAFYAAVEIGEDLQYALQAGVELPAQVTVKDRLTFGTAFTGRLTIPSTNFPVEVLENLKFTTTFAGSLTDTITDVPLPVEALQLSVDFAGTFTDNTPNLDRVLYAEGLQIGTEFSGTLYDLSGPDTELPQPVEGLSIITAFSGTLENV